MLLEGGNCFPKHFLASRFPRKSWFPRFIKCRGLETIASRSLSAIWSRAGFQAVGQMENYWGVRSFGVFDVKIRKSRVGHNPKRPGTDAPITSRAVVKFKAGKAMRAAVLNSPRTPATIINLMNYVGLDLSDFSGQYLRAAHIVSLLSVWMLVGLFYYLNHYTKRDYFTVWTVAWLFYALWLTLGLKFDAVDPESIVFKLKQCCVSISAVHLLWGSLRSFRIFQLQ